MKPISNEQLENDLAVFSNMEVVNAPDFFYTRLSARMEKDSISNELRFTIKPILIICALALFLFMNSLLLKEDTNIVKTNPNQNIEALAAAYDQNISN